MTKIRAISHTGTCPDRKTDAFIREESRKRNLFRILMGILFVCYVGAVLYLVLIERIIHGNLSRFHGNIVQMPYLTQVKAFIQPVPFRTIRHYMERLRQGSPLRRFAVMNLAGNLMLFMPMGIFLPYFRKKQRNPFRFTLTMIFMISCVEIAQLFTLLGACDIDDLILNLTGALAGFLLFHIMNFLKKRGENR